MNYHDLPSGYLVTVKYLGATNSRGSRWKATYRRDRDTVFSATIPYDHPDDHYKAAQAVLKKVDTDRRKTLPDCPPCRIIARCFDDGSYGYVASTY